MDNPPSGHLLLIDGLNVVRRIYEAVPSEDSPEKAQGALKASLGKFRRVLIEHQPTHVLAPFDFGGPTWRHAIYQDYRAGRKPMPQDLRNVLPSLFEKLREMGVATLQVAGVEADDVIAAVCLKWLEAERGEVTVLSTDKDLAVLGSWGARVQDPFKQIWHDEEWCQDKFGVDLARIHELLALAGDSTDGIPGVPGVAAKTAAKLLNTYGTLDGVLEHAEEIKGKLGEHVRESAELIALARQLVAFKTDMALGLTFRALRYAGGAS
jgi:DNA polymerase-1